MSCVSENWTSCSKIENQYGPANVDIVADRHKEMNVGNTAWCLHRECQANFFL